MKKLPLKTTIVGAAALTLSFAAPAFAARQGPTGSIDLMPADSAGIATLAESDSASHYYGDSVSFETYLDGRVSNKAEVFVTVSCGQDGSLVYRYSGGRDFSFPLLDQKAYEWDGGDASCEASLVYWVEKGKQIEYTVLDSVPFEVRGVINA